MLLAGVLAFAACTEGEVEQLDASERRADTGLKLPDATPHADAQAKDASPPGTGDAEATPDAQEDDAGTLDAGQDDASAPDATFPDAELADASAPDATFPDAELTDTGVCDDPDLDQRGPGCALGPDCAPGDGTLFLPLSAFIDGDGDGATLGEAVLLCTDGTLPPGYQSARGAEDCDDLRRDRHPNHVELPDCVDHDCDGTPMPLGDGHLGDLVATATNTATFATELAMWAQPGDPALVVTSTAGWSAGDLALVWAVFGADAGTYGLYRVSPTSSVALSLDRPLEGTYGRDTLTWVVRVEQYRNVRIPAGATVSARTWLSGVDPGAGIIAWAVSGKLTVETGAILSASGACSPGGTGSWVRTQIGTQGTSHDGTPAASRSPNFTGGGGGYSPSLTNACGGGGGHGTPGANGQSHPAYGALPGFGGLTAGTSSVASLFCGGGGGGGGLDSDAGANSHGGNGGAGGGVIFLMVHDLELYGRIEANGGIGADGVYFGPASPGGGGGGAGGTIFVSASTISVGLGVLSAEGGGGGRGSEAGGGNYRGGKGGFGRIRAELPGDLVTSPSSTRVCP